MLKLISYNISHCTDLENPSAEASRSADFILHSDADIVCLQEFYSYEKCMELGTIASSQVKALRAKYPYSTSGKEIDETILSRYPLHTLSVDHRPDLKYFMYEAVRVDYPGHPFTLVSLHLTSYGLTGSERNIASHVARKGIKGIEESARSMKRSVYGKLSVAFAERAVAARIVAELVDNLPQGDLILCGDFNDVPGSYAYYTILRAGLKDAYADTGLGPMTTYNASGLFFHIDQILYRGDIRPLNVTIGKLRASDHYPLSATFQF